MYERKKLSSPCSGHTHFIKRRRIRKEMEDGRQERKEGRSLKNKNRNQRMKLQNKGIAKEKG